MAEKQYLDKGGLEHTWSKMKTYMGNAYASKSHTHTASQITDFTTQVDNRINSKMPNMSAFVRKRSSTYVVNSNRVNSAENVYLPSMAVGELMFFNVYYVRNASGNSARAYLKAPSGGTYSFLNFSSGSFSSSGIASDVSGGGTIASSAATSYPALGATGIILRKS